MARKGKGERIRREVDVAPSVPLAPRYLSFVLFCVALCLPNLVFSGSFFFSSLHLAKWMCAFLPIGLLGAVVGWRLLFRGAARTSFRMDGFAVVWLLLLLYCAVQPLWAEVRSTETLWREWLFFAALWLVYVLGFNLADGRLLRAALWGGVLSAALCVLLAEMQIRGLAEVCPGLFYTTAKDYLANTGQRNMLALWLAMGGLNSAHLLLSGAGRARAAAGALFAVNVYGLFSTNSLSGFAAFFTGMGLLLLLRLRVAGRGARRAAGVFLLVAAAGSALLLLSPAGERFSPLLRKMSRYATAATEAGRLAPWMIVGDRGTIWATSWAMIGERPVRGVGLGQFKWNYLQAQREALRRWPHLPWGYTQWAHNEFLQWLAETGAVGAAGLLFLWLWWLWGTLRALMRGMPLSREAAWGCAMVALFTMDAMWTRPFHRIENVMWLALGFAVANRELLGGLFPLRWRERARVLARPMGAVICLGSVLGLVYLADGVRGDRNLRLAMLATNPLERGTLLQRAHGSPMVRDLAERQLAYYYIQFGELQEDADLIARGVNSLIDVFEKQPQTDDLKELRRWAVKLKHVDLDRYVSYYTDVPADLVEVGGGGL